MKIPPRTMFTCQVAATTISCFVQVFIMRFALAHIPSICTSEQAQHFTCPSAKVFHSASVIWGLLGPARIFSPGQTYSLLLLGFPVGALLPVVLHFVAKRWPRSPVHWAMAPLILGGSAAIPPATPLNYLSWGVVGFVFQKFIRTRYSAWWQRLNYITASALDTGLAISTLFIFFVFTMTNVQAPSWW
jgi:OPT family oligopeptide transporter